MRLEGWETQINSEPIMQIERPEANHAVSHFKTQICVSWNLELTPTMVTKQSCEIGRNAVLARWAKYKKDQQKPD